MATITGGPSSAASMLLGKTVNSGWVVVEALPKGQGSTGGHFSYGYIVERAGQRAFLKALDLTLAFQSQNWIEEINWLTSAFLYERDLLVQCREKKLSRVVRAIDEGSIDIPGAFPPQVQYLIFELADGDIRKLLTDVGAFDTAWALRALHPVATGLFQLHRNGIVHQDMKPSNVLTFKAEKASKVGDLGRASARAATAKHDAFTIAGDASHAPPELLYREVPGDWNARRMGCDAYHLGSLITFMFTTMSLTPLIRSRLPQELWPENWGGTYPEVLAHVVSAFEAVLKEDLAPAISERFRDEVVLMVRQLSNPDPNRRGHPKNQKGVGSRVSLERYVAVLNRLATTAETQLRR